MAHTDRMNYFGKGIEALRNNHLFLARACFEQAVGAGNDPASCSYLAWCRAKLRGEYKEASALAEKGLAQEPTTPLHYLNLGRIHLLAGNKVRAMEVFRQGLPFDNYGEIVKELEQLGSRKTPLFPSLSRAHPLNHYLGLLMSRLGSR